MDLSSAYSVLSNVYANYSRASDCFYVYTYRPFYDPEKKRTLKKDIQSIGKILSADGIGTIEFNSRFLNANPGFVDFKVKRTARNKIHIEPVSRKAPYDAGALLEARHMKIGATYFISEILKHSYTGKALKALTGTKITKTQYQILLSVLIYAVYEGVKHLGAIEYFIRDHVMPYKKNINKDTVQRLFDVLDSEFIVAFYKKKHEIMKAELSQNQTSLKQRRYIALDGTNIDVNAKNINNADYGKAKSGNETPVVNFLTLIDQCTGTLMGHCTYSGHTTDIATLEGAVKQLAYYGCKHYTVIIDRGYWSLYNVSVMYNMGLDFLAHVKTSHGIIKKFIEQHIDDLSVGNGCDKIENGNEVNYAKCFDLSWRYFDIKEGKRINRPIYMYAYYNTAIASTVKAQLEDEVRELNADYDEYKHSLSKAVAQHKKKPEEYRLKGKYLQLLDDGIITLNTKYNRYDICNEAAFRYCQLNAVWILASTQKDSCEECYHRYRQRNEIEVMYRYFKNHVDAETLNVSTEHNFSAKLFTGLIASEFLNSLKLRISKWNKENASLGTTVKLKDNSMYMTFKELDTLECIYHDDTIIPTSNILKRQENLFNMMNINPVVLQNTKLKKATIDEDMGLVLSD